MRFFSLANLSEQNVEELDPRQTKRPNFPDKEEFRKWCNDINTKHCFFCHTEAITPSLRVTTNNSPFYLHGFTADYDSEVDQTDVLRLIACNSPSGLLPRFVSSTFSGGIRLTWEFSEPVLVDQPELAERFMKLLVSELGARNLCAGFDEASLKLGQYYEAGQNWTEIPNSKPISDKILEVLFFRAANQAKIKADGPIIPIEKVAEQVEKLYPGRVKEFAVGQRVPLYWVEPFQDRTGAMIGDLGMLCYSTRAGKSFVGWSEILGAEFMRQYQAERVGEAAKNLYFDGKHYWRRGEGGEFSCRTKEDTIMYLKSQGINPRPEAKSYASEADRVLLAVQEQHEVKAAAPIIHDSRLLVHINGEKYLNIASVKLMKPEGGPDKKKFPWINLFFENIWADPKEIQQIHYLAWLRHAYMSCLEGRPAPGQAIFVAGPTSSGKTFMNQHILGKIFGGWSDATEFLMGRTNFNKADSEVYLWAIDDTKGAASWENKAAFSAAIKKHVANPQIRCEPKGKNAFTIPWKGRISVTCNQDKESRDIIPHLNLNIKDKISLFEWNCWRAPFKGGGKTEIEVEAELPHFLAWLIAWKPPAEVFNSDPRYIINSYHHPKMLQEAAEMSAAARLRELLDLWIDETTPRIKTWATPARIRKNLSEEPSCRDALKEFSRQRMAAALEELGVEVRKNGSTVEYLIYDPK